MQIGLKYKSLITMIEVLYNSTIPRYNRSEYLLFNCKNNKIGIFTSNDGLLSKE